MIDMLTMWFWAYVIGVGLAAVITLFAIVVLIRAIMQTQERESAQTLPRSTSARSERCSSPSGSESRPPSRTPATGEPATVRVTAAEDGKVTVIVEAVPGSPVKVTPPPNVDVIYQYKVPDSHTLH